MKQHAQLTPDRTAARPPQGAAMRVQRKCDCGGAGGSGGSCGPCDEEKKKKVQRRAIEATTPEIPQSVHRVLQNAGRPLDHDTRSSMESRFGHDFSRVRVHTDTHAAASARDIHAAAYTAGTHIVFGDRRFEPQTAKGRHLLAHELAHVVQQKSGSAIPAGIGAHDDAHERAADVVANHVAAHGPAFAPKPLPKRAPDRILRRERDEDVPEIVHEVLAAPGIPLDRDTRAWFEPRFHYDFSNVRVHDDDRAAQSAEAVGARAYTVGPHIVLGEPEPPQALLAHELGHVVQQRNVDMRQGIETGETHEHTGATLTRPRLQRGIGSFFLDILLFIPRLFGMQFFTDGQLRDYLEGLRTRRGPQYSLFSDNMARACVDEEGELGPYDTQTKIWLVKDMLDGLVSSSDEESIITLLRRSRDRQEIVTGVGRENLWKDFTGRNRRVVEALTLTAADATPDLFQRLRTLDPDLLQDYSDNTLIPQVLAVVRRAATFRHITAPVPPEAVLDRAGVATFQINGIDVIAEPDVRSSDPKMGSGNITRFNLRRTRDGNFTTDEHGLVDSFTPPHYAAVVTTIYGPKTPIQGESAYGRGTTEADQAAGTTSIRFHESRHGQDWFDYLSDHPLPQFHGRVGMTEAQFVQAIRDQRAAVEEYKRQASLYSARVSDCVGTLPTAAHFTASGMDKVPDVVAICREMRGRQ